MRERVASDPPSAGFLLYDLEGELFFGAAPELERVLAQTRRCAQAGVARHVLLRLKRVRNPDVVSLELFEHFLKQCRDEGPEVWLAGLQPDLLASFRRAGLTAWSPAGRLFPQAADEDSATLAAIRGIRAALSTQGVAAQSSRLYYLV